MFTSKNNSYNILSAGNGSIFLYYFLFHIFPPFYPSILGVCEGFPSPACPFGLHNNTVSKAERWWKAKDHPMCFFIFIPGWADFRLAGFTPRSINWSQVQNSVWGGRGIELKNVVYLSTWSVQEFVFSSRTEFLILSHEKFQRYSMHAYDISHSKPYHSKS